MKRDTDLVMQELNEHIEQLSQHTHELRALVRTLHEKLEPENGE